MKRKIVMGFVLTGILAFVLCSCRAGEDGIAAPDRAQTSPYSSPSEPPEMEKTFSFTDLKRLQFCFCSGAGAWSTLLTIGADGSFSGAYHDSDMGGGEDIHGIQYRCDFTGQFTQPEQVNDYTYSVRIAQLTYEHEVGEDEIIDGIHYYYTDAYGLEDAEEILIYLPGAPLAQLPQEFRTWVGYYNIEVGELPFYALNNEARQQGFAGSDRVKEAKDSVAWVEAYATELETDIQENAALTQGELNERSQELYNLWDVQLNELWAVLKQILPPEDMQTLTAEELEWISWKEEQTYQAGMEFGGGSLSPMAQAQRAAQLTRERVYELLELLED